MTGEKVRDGTAAGDALAAVGQAPARRRASLLDRARAFATRHVQLRATRRDGLRNNKYAGERIVRLGGDLLAVEKRVELRAADGELHVRLPGGVPYLAHQDVGEDDRTAGRGLRGYRVRATGLARRELGLPHSIGVGPDTLDIAVEGYDHRLECRGCAGNADRHVALQDHVIRVCVEYREFPVHTKTPPPDSPYRDMRCRKPACLNHTTT